MSNRILIIEPSAIITKGLEQVFSDLGEFEVCGILQDLSGIGESQLRSMGADVILVVRDGKIVERGTHRELMARQGHYHALFTRQYEDRATAAALDGRK